MTSFDAAVRKFVDDKFSDDVKSLKKVESLYADVLERKKDLEKQLSFIANDKPTKIEVGIDSTRSTLEAADELQQTRKEVESNLDSYLNKTQPGVEKYEQSVEECGVVKKCHSYLKWIAQIEETSARIQQLILSDSLREACQTFKQLTNFSTQLIEGDTKCTNLVAFLKKTIMFWHNIVVERLSSDLDVVLKQISWPFITGPGPKRLLKVDVPPDTPSPYHNPDPASGLDDVIGCLLCIELPKHLRVEEKVHSLGNLDKEDKGIDGNGDPDQEENVRSPSDEDTDDHILLPFQLLLKPLKKRFKYHFSGKKATNSIQKPEWFLSQVLNWVGNHSGFLENALQEILDKNGYQHVDALMMFTKGLLELVNEKLSSDMEEVIFIDDFFMHTVDEVLLFHRELSSAYLIPDSMLKIHSPLNILTRPQCLIKWLNIEKMCALERLDSLLSSDEAWQTKFEESDESDEMKTPQCAESFITLLLTITDRYKSLPNTAGQLRFLDLQLLLLDDFRIRLTQMIRSIGRNQFEEVRFSILNAAYYITLVLQDWADNVFFLQLKYSKDQLATDISEQLLPDTEPNSAVTAAMPIPADTSTDETVFESTVKLFDRICNEGVNDFVQVVATEFSLKCQPYAYDDWPSMPTPDEQVSMLVSRSACSMLEVIQDRLFLFEESLCRTLFIQVWHGIAEYVDDHLFKEVVMRNRFNAGGASQFDFDMKRNLFPLFRSLTNKPENFFKRIKEACILLNLQLGSALLLMELLNADGESSEKAEDPAKVLLDMNISLLAPKDAARVMKRRIDWSET